MDSAWAICSELTQDQSNLRITHRLWTGFVVRSSSPADYGQIYAPAPLPLPHTAASKINYSVLLIIPWSTFVIWTYTSYCTCPRFPLWRNELETRRYHGVNRHRRLPWPAVKLESKRPAAAFLGEASTHHIWMPNIIQTWTANKRENRKLFSKARVLYTLTVIYRSSW